MHRRSFRQTVDNILAVCHRLPEVGQPGRSAQRTCSRGAECASCPARRAFCPELCGRGAASIRLPKTNPQHRVYGRRAGDEHTYKGERRFLMIRTVHKGMCCQKILNLNEPLDKKSIKLGISMVA